MSSEQKEMIFKAKPLLALSCMGLSYGLMGWYCAALDAYWKMGSWLIAMALTLVLIWGWNALVQFILLSPRILVLILALSMTLTIAVSFSNVFILMIMLIASTLFSRLELQTAGVQRLWTLVIISVISGGMIGAGWFVGNTLYQNDLPKEITWNPGQAQARLTTKSPPRWRASKIFSPMAF